MFKATRRAAAVLALTCLLATTLTAQVHEDTPIPRTPEMHVITSGSPVRAVAISPDGRLVAFSHSLPPDRKAKRLTQYVITLWDVEKDEARHMLSGHSISVVALAFDGEGKTLVSASCARTADKTPCTQIITWNVGNGTVLKEASLKDAGWILGLSLDQRVLLTVSPSSKKVVQAWDLPTAHRLLLEGHSTSVSFAIVLDDGMRIATIGESSPRLIVWDFSSGKKTWSNDLNDFMFSERCVAFSPDAKTLMVAGSRDSYVFDVATGKSTLLKRAGIGLGAGVQFTPAGKHFAYSRFGVDLFSLEKRKCVAILAASGDPACGPVFFSADGRRAVATDLVSRIRIWDMPKLDP